MSGVMPLAGESRSFALLRMTTQIGQLKLGPDLKPRCAGGGTARGLPARRRLHLDPVVGFAQAVFVGVAGF